MRTSPAGIALIREFEGLRLRAYQDSVGVWTIGYGSTRYADGTPVQEGDTISEPAAESLLRATLTKYEQGVLTTITAPLSQAQFDACVSLAYNVGVGAFAKSTLAKHLNAGRVADAANEFRKWNRAGGRVLAGLTRRREVERALFLNGETIAATPPAVPVSRKESPMPAAVSLAFVRHLLTFGGGFLIARGYLDAATMEAIIGGLVTVIGAVWSVAEKKARV